VIGLLVVLLRLARLGSFRMPEGTDVESESQQNRALNWIPPDQQSNDRRQALRRNGLPTPIYVTGGKYQNIEAFVLDRSTGGLRIAVQYAFPRGSIIQIRAQSAPPEIPWINVIVRSSQTTGDYYELGCQFEETLPWNIMLLFG
jgi:hypothetical protein